MRNRLFKYWFDSYEFNSKFSLYTTHIIDEEGVPNFAALILRNDNPKIVEVLTEFTQTAKLLRTCKEISNRGVLTSTLKVSLTVFS